MMSQSENQTEASLPVILSIHAGLLKNQMADLKKPGTKNIHNFRVWVKKMRTLLDLTEEITGGEFKRKSVYKFIKPLYRAAGELRKSQINIKLVHSLTEDAEIQQHFIRKINSFKKENKKEFLKIIQEFHFNQFQHAIQKMLLRLDEFQDNELAENLTELQKDSYRKILHIINQYHHQDGLHNIRKELKIMLTLNEVAKHTHSSSFRSEEFFKKASVLENTIGQRNDILCLIQWLNKNEKVLSKNKLKNLFYEINNRLLIELTLIQEDLKNLMSQDKINAVLR